jgi:hypothetical protein
MENLCNNTRFKDLRTLMQYSVIFTFTKSRLSQYINNVDIQEIYIKVKAVRAERNPHCGFLINVHTREDKEHSSKFVTSEAIAESTEHLS